jgi:hypothetical protein
MTEGGYVVWSRYEPREVWGRSPDGQTRKLADGLFGLPVLTPDGPWAIVQTHTELLCLPWGAADCIILRPGNDNNLYPDALWVNGSILVAWNTANGTPGQQSVDIHGPREPLPGTDPIQPPIEPEPDMDFPAAEWSIVEQMHARFSGNFPPTEDGARGWTEMTIQQLVHSYPSGGWCWKKSGQSSPPSKDCIARQTGGRFEGWDVLMSAGAQGPKVLATDPAYHDLAGQVPIAVPPVNHLGGVVVEPPTDGKHAYTRDDDERDECNFIMPDGSQCDQPKAAEIHQVTDPIDPPDPPDPIDPPTTGGVTNAQIMAQLQRLSVHLGLR